MINLMPETMQTKSGLLGNAANSINLLKAKTTLPFSSLLKENTPESIETIIDGRLEKEFSVRTDSIDGEGAEEEQPGKFLPPAANLPPSGNLLPPREQPEFGKESGPEELATQPLELAGSALPQTTSSNVEPAKIEGGAPNPAVAPLPSGGGQSPKPAAPIPVKQGLTLDTSLRAQSNSMTPAETALSAELAEPEFRISESRPVQSTARVDQPVATLAALVVDPKTTKLSKNIGAATEGLNKTHQLASEAPPVAARGDAAALPSLAAAQPSFAIQTPPSVLPGAGFGALPAPSEEMQSMIDNLVHARESGRTARGDVLLRHGEFGSVTVKIERGENDLRALVSSRDPGFAPAASAALAERSQLALSEQNAAFARQQDSGGQSQNTRDQSAHPGSDRSNAQGNQTRPDLQSQSQNGGQNGNQHGTQSGTSNGRWRAPEIGSDPGQEIGSLPASSMSLRTSGLFA